MFAPSARLVQQFLFFGVIHLAAMAGITMAVNLGAQQIVELPYDSRNPVIYDNDDAIDAYTDDYLMALASAKEIKLLGMITSTSVQPYNKHVAPPYYEKMVTDRGKGVQLARGSGLSNVPDPVRGPKGHLQRPPSGKIEDTKPIETVGSWLIANKAKEADPRKPLVVVMGGPLTVVADAYLLDNSISDRVVVAWLGGREHDMAGYNGWADPWAAYIVLQRLKLIQFPAWKIGVKAAPFVPKHQLLELPDTELRRWMIEKQMTTNRLPDDRDGDAPPAIALVRADYVLEAKRVSFSHWVTNNGREQPAFKEDSNGTALVVTEASGATATKEWWSTMKNPAAWGIPIHKEMP